MGVVMDQQQDTQAAEMSLNLSRASNTSYSTGPKICVVLPTRNEEAAITQVIQDIRNELSQAGYQEPVILVVDDSADSTRRLARAAGAIVINGGNKGLGHAMYVGLKSAVRHQPDVIVCSDSDGQSDPREIARFVQPVLDDEADLVIGSRFLEKDLVQYRYKYINRLGVLVLSRLIRTLSGVPVTDSHGGIRAMRPEVAAKLEIIGTHTYVQETIIDAAHKGFRVKEIPSVWRPRRKGTSRVVRSIPTYVFYALPILFLRSGRHVTWLSTLGVVFVLLGIVDFFVVLWQAGFNVKATFSRLPSFVLIALLVSMGAQFFFFGFILQVLKEMKTRIDRLVYDTDLLHE